MRRLVLFPDTNVFLQCKKLNELSWEGFPDADTIELLVGTPIQDEIDRLKHDGNHRRARRARDANSLFRDMLNDPSGTIVVREQSPRVTLGFAPAMAADHAIPPTLDMTRADDRLIDEVLQFRLRNQSAQILSDDTGMLLRCRRHGVTCFRIDPTWILPAENDERDREIQNLRSKLRRFEQTEPKFELSIKNAEGAVIRELSATVPAYDELSPADIGRLVRQIVAQHPKATDFGVSPPERPAPNGALDRIVASMHEWRAPSQQEIQEYGVAYDNWAEAIERDLDRLSFLLNVSSRIASFRVEIQNSGYCPADEVLVRITAHAGLRLCVSANAKVPGFIRSLDKLKTKAEFASPPKAPKGSYVVSGLAGMNSWHNLAASHLSLLNEKVALPPPRFVPSMANRDRHSFYREDERSGPQSRCTFSRIEFRHQSESQVFRIWLLVPPNVSPRKSHIHCTISARNLRKPMHCRMPLAFTYETRSTLEVANKWRVVRHSDVGTSNTLDR